MNMHYCRFENTVNDMIDCIEDMDISEMASKEEKEARKKFVELCVKVAEDYKHELKNARRFTHNHKRINASFYSNRGCSI